LLKQHIGQEPLSNPRSASRRGIFSLRNLTRRKSPFSRFALQ
jgi:hypothetical protein